MEFVFYIKYKPTKKIKVLLFYEIYYFEKIPSAFKFFRLEIDNLAHFHVKFFSVGIDIEN